MADERNERRKGDVVRSATAPLLGALGGGALVLSLAGGSIVMRVAAFATRAWSGQGGLEDARSLLGAIVAPILLGAFGGALALGLLQTQGYVGWPSVRIEARRPSPVVAFAGWAVLLCVLFDAARLLITLHAGASAPNIAFAASIALGRALRGTLVVVLAVAIVDQLLRARARTQRLALDDVPYRRPSQPSAPPTWIDYTSYVLYEAERALAVDAQGIVRARGVGLAAIALREAARTAGKRVRAVPGLEALDAVAIGAALPAEWRR